MLVFLVWLVSGRKGSRVHRKSNHLGSEVRIFRIKYRAEKVWLFIKKDCPAEN